MADLVQAVMERMVPDFEDLEEVGYFTKQELKQVIDRRLHFEYLIKSAVRKKEDFMRYIDYEIKLERLRELRRKRFPASTPLEASNADRCIIGNIHNIFSRATRIYKNDVQLWMEWFQFCKMSKSFAKLSKAITEALRYNSHCADLWIMAGQWEFNDRNNPTGARSLMLLGIRMCRNSKQLWFEYFKMELAYAQRLAARRAILGLDANALGEEDAAMKDLLSGGVAIRVFNQACNSIPDDFQFRVKFLKHVADTEFDGAQHVADHIFQSIMKDFPGHTDTWDMQARYSYSSNLTKVNRQEATECAYNVYLKGLSAYPSEDLYECCCFFLLELLNGAKSSVDSDDCIMESTMNRVQTLMLDCTKNAMDNGLASENLLLQWISLSKPEGCDLESLSRAQKATELKPGSVRLWCERIALFKLARMKVDDAGDFSFDGGELKDLMKAALASVPKADHWMVWQQGLEISVTFPVILDWIQAGVFESFTASTNDKDRQSLVPVVCALIEAFWLTIGPEKTREVYSCALNLPKPPVELMLQVLGLEAQCVGTNLGNFHICRKLFESAVKNHPKNLAVWMAYARFEHLHGDHSRKIYKRAVRLLDNSEIQKFIEYYNSCK